MNYTLENNNISIVTSTYGGEIHSLKSKKDNVEYLWNGNPQYWKYHAPILFPIVGKVKNLQYKVDGKTYELPQHGLARISDFSVINQEENSITFELKYSEETLKVYPFKFSLHITYTLLENGVNVQYAVNNLDDKNILFSIGAHPAFMCPIEEGLTLDDYYFKFNEKENCPIMLLTSEGLFTREKKDFMKDSDIIPLSNDLFKNDALVFDSLKSNKISIESKKSNKSLTVDFTGFTHLGLWAPATGAPFVCIEPWFGHADFADFDGEFKDKQGIIDLGLNERFECNFVVTI